MKRRLDRYFAIRKGQTGGSSDREGTDADEGEESIPKIEGEGVRHKTNLICPLPLQLH
jgi:hypothetical protein